MNCVYHNKPMKQNSRGWYCPSKLEDGSWCKYKGGAAPAQPSMPRQPQNPDKSWDRIGKEKALCGMVNGMLSAGIDPTKIDLLTLNAIFNKIQTLSGAPVTTSRATLPIPVIQQDAPASDTYQQDPQI